MNKIDWEFTILSIISLVVFLTLPFTLGAAYWALVWGVEIVQHSWIWPDWMNELTSSPQGSHRLW